MIKWDALDLVVGLDLAVSRVNGLVADHVDQVHPDLKAVQNQGQEQGLHLAVHVEAEVELLLEAVLLEEEVALDLDLDHPFLTENVILEVGMHHNLVNVWVSLD